MGGTISFESQTRRFGLLGRTMNLGSPETAALLVLCAAGFVASEPLLPQFSRTQRAQLRKLMDAFDEAPIEIGTNSYRFHLPSGEVIPADAWILEACKQTSDEVCIAWLSAFLQRV